MGGLCQSTSRLLVHILSMLIMQLKKCPANSEKQKLGLFPGRTVKTMQTRYSFGRRVLGPSTPTQPQLPLYPPPPVYASPPANDVPPVYESPHPSYPSPTANPGAYDGNTITLSHGEVDRPFAPTSEPPLGPGAYEDNTIVIECGESESDTRPLWDSESTNLNTGPVQHVMRTPDVPIPTIGESFLGEEDSGNDTDEFGYDYCTRCEECQYCEDCKRLREARTPSTDIPDNVKDPRSRCVSDITSANQLTNAQFDTVRSDGWTAFRARPVPATPEFEASQSPSDIDLIVTPPDTVDVMDIDGSRVQRIARKCIDALVSGARRDETEAAVDLLTFSRSYEDADMRF